MGILTPNVPSEDYIYVQRGNRIRMRQTEGMLLEVELEGPLVIEVVERGEDEPVPL